MSHQTTETHDAEHLRQTIRQAFAAWQDGTAPITDVFATEMVWRVEGHFARIQGVRRQAPAAPVVPASPLMPCAPAAPVAPFAPASPLMPCAWCAGRTGSTGDAGDPEGTLVAPDACGTCRARIAFQALRADRSRSTRRPGRSVGAAEGIRAVHALRGLRRHHPLHTGREPVERDRTLSDAARVDDAGGLRSAGADGDERRQHTRNGELEIA
jgi:hypothetical protein